MRRLERRAAWAAGLAGAAFAFAPLMAAAAAPQPKSAADCRAISDFELRGQCWDALDKANQQDSTATKKREFGLGLHLPSVAAVKPKKEQVEAERRRESEDVKSLSLTVASVDNTPLGRLLLTASDGAVWEQTDSDTITRAPSPGDVVEVSKGMLGGYMCHVSRWQSVRCQRDQ